MNRRRYERRTEKRKSFSLLLSLGIVGGLASVLLLMGVGMSGARTREWVEISSPEEWEQYLLDEDSPDYDLGGHYRLTADLDLTGYSWSIGTNYRPFTGRLDGGGYVVEGLDRPMFGVTKGARIENLLIDRCSIQYPFTYYDGKEAVDGYASLIAYAVDTEIKDCGAVGEMYINAPRRATLVLENDYTVTATPSEAGKASPSDAENKIDTDQSIEETAAEAEKPEDSTAEKTEAPKETEKDPSAEKQDDSTSNQEEESQTVDDTPVPLADRPVVKRLWGRENSFHTMGRMESGMIALSSAGGSFSMGDSSDSRDSSGSGAGSSHSGSDSYAGDSGNNGSGASDDSGGETGSNESGGSGSETGSNESADSGGGTGSNESADSGGGTGSDTEEDTEHESSSETGNGGNGQDESGKTDENPTDSEQPDIPDSDSGKADITDTPSGDEEVTEPSEENKPEQNPTDNTQPGAEETEEGQDTQGGKGGGGTKPVPEETFPEETLPEETAEPEIEKEDENEAYYVEVTAQQIVAGGLVAQADGKSLITESFSFMNISAEDTEALEAQVLSAGFCGRLGEGTRVESSYASGLMDVGGVSAGFAGYNAGKLQDCFATYIMGERCENAYAFVGKNLEGKGHLNMCMYDRQIACAQDVNATGVNTARMIGDEGRLPGENWYCTENAYPQIAYFANHENETFRLRSGASAIALILPEDITLSDALKAVENGLVLPAEINGEEIKWSAEGAVSITDDNRAVFNASGSEAVNVQEDETKEAGDVDNTQEPSGEWDSAEEPDGTAETVPESSYVA